MAKNGEKLGIVEKVGKGGKSWKKLEKVGKKLEKVVKVGKAGEKWEKVLEVRFAPKTIGFFHYVLSMAMPNMKLIGEFVTQLERPQVF